MNFINSVVGGNQSDKFSVKFVRLIVILNAFTANGFIIANVIHHW